jgi:hypothetical protein
MIAKRYRGVHREGMPQRPFRAPQAQDPWPLVPVAYDPYGRGLYPPTEVLRISLAMVAPRG